MATPDSHRFSVGARSTRVVLAAIVVGALALGAIFVATDSFGGKGDVANTGIGNSKPKVPTDAFTESNKGDCLDWPGTDRSKVGLVSCNKPHTFEVAGEIDTANYPGTDFGENAPWPGNERFAEIQAQQCQDVVRNYLKGKFDPDGRFTTGLMFPSTAQWEAGVRKLRCGLQLPGSPPQKFTGKVAEQDQSLHWPAGTCVAIDERTKQATGATVPCSSPHAFEVSATVDLSSKFGAASSTKPWPPVAEQDKYLETTCQSLTTRYLGSNKKLEQVSLNVQWSNLKEVSWIAGSRTAVCYIGRPSGDKKGFATLVGSAKSGTLLVDGKVPTPPAPQTSGRRDVTPAPLPPGYQPDPAETQAPG